MTLRERWQRRVAVFVAVAFGLLALSLAGPGAAGASPGHPTVPAATPVPSATTSPLQVTLPGLLTVTVDLPTVAIDLLGGRRSAARAPATSEPGSASTPTPAAPLPASSAPPTTAPLAPNRAGPLRAAPSRAASRSGGRTGGGSRQVFTVGNDRGAAARPEAANATKPAAPRPTAEAFEGMLHTGLPIWALAGIVALCGIGTILVVRRAGVRPSGTHRSD